VILAGFFNFTLFVEFEFLLKNYGLICKFFYDRIPSFFVKMKIVKKYFKECLHELRQVKWPTKNEAIRISTITLIFVIVCAFGIGLLDSLLTKILLLVR
jgi:preprotein translocase SecE subunit